VSEQMIQTISEKIAQIPRKDLASQMIMHLALQELVTTIQRNEKLLETHS